MSSQPQKSRLRFAPSPTGYLHIGGARTALYNYLLARQTGGTFILRIEDTDRERSTPEAVQAILDGMKWLGLTWDEGPFFQTERYPLYHQHIDKLVAEGKAYPCFCSAELLSQKRDVAMAEKRKPMYDRTCLKLSAEVVAEKVKHGEPHCIRFKSPDEGEIVVHDVVKGDVKVANRELDDLIIKRTDGNPTYNFTVVVDDVTMGMTHVIRGDDHLNNTPRQIQLYEAFGYPVPTFAHVPMILGADKKRLSKRHGATSVLAYEEMGYLPEALLNYLVRLGWSYKDQEVFTMAELIEKFSLQSVSGSPGVFNPEKLLWLNGVYIRECSGERLAGLTEKALARRGITVTDQSALLRGVEASREKVKTIVEMAEMVDFFFAENPVSDELRAKFFTTSNLALLRTIHDKLLTLEKWDHDGLKNVFEQLTAETTLGLGKLAQPLRVVLTGRTISPGIFEILEILGKTKSLERLVKYLA